MENNRSYRIRTKVGSEAPNRIELPLTQTYDMFEILSLKLNQKNEYNYYDADYGVIVGRILANGGFGIPNARVSVFMPVEDSASLKERILYNYSSTQDTNYDGVKYNLLPDFVDNACHQDVGTFPNKRLVLDNDDVIEIFDKYYKYTTVTNEAGDYMIFGVPTGTQTVHVDLDMSDIGVLSQRPRDMVYKGYNINQFESPNKFKKSTNLNSLSQLYSQDKGVYVYPYWGNSENRSEGSAKDTIAITRCDISIEYKFEPTAVFIGSIVTDKGSNAIGKNCTGTDTVGKMADLAAGEGSIEMIRKTLDNKVESFPIKGNRLINGDGVWCYQIPMNLDYIMTDEFGNIVPTDDPDKGIPTRTRVRFRISLDDAPSDATAHKRCRFLVPNNPRWDSDYPEFMKSKEADYEFGSFTREESYCDMFWNNVYTVKSYIPRLQKNTKVTNRKHTGIKMVNHYGDNNPMPYNNLSLKLGFTFRLICILTKILVYFIAFINTLLALLMLPICLLVTIFKSICRVMKKIPLVGSIIAAPFCKLEKVFSSMIMPGITLGSSFCDDGINNYVYYPTIVDLDSLGCVKDKIMSKVRDEIAEAASNGEVLEFQTLNVSNLNNNKLITCIENSLAQENESTSFNFENDWINGVLYAPLWYRKITPKKSFLFGLIKKKAKDQWCGRDNGDFGLKLLHPCALGHETGGSFNSPVTGKTYPKPVGINNDCGKKCNKSISLQTMHNGLILKKETLLGESVYYYNAAEYDTNLSYNNSQRDGVVLLFATDIVLLGSLNDCDINGIPQFFKNLESTTYNLPTDILFTDSIIQMNGDGNPRFNEDGTVVFNRFTEMTGCDWGNLNTDECGKMGEDTDGGLFYGIGCSNIEVERKSCLNLSRICEIGVSLDESKEIPDMSTIDSADKYESLTPDGFISFDEIYNVDARSMFATLNGNRLHTRLNNKNGLKEYDLRYLYIDNFDGLAQSLMRNSGSCNYTKNHLLEKFSLDYYMFRMGTDPFYYDVNNSLPRYENSFYFYFGLKMGKTAIDKFNSEFFSPCFNEEGAVSPIKIELSPNSWCSDNTSEADGYVILDLTDVSKPYDILINSLDDSAIGYETTTSLNEDKLFLGRKALTQDTEKQDLYNLFDADLHKKEEDGSISTIDHIPNGRYSLTVTDGDGEIITTKFTLMPKKVTFTYTPINLEKPNNQRIQEDIDTTTILKKASSSKENAEEYGGYIIFNNIIDDIKEGKYNIYIRPYSNNTSIPDWKKKEDSSINKDSTKYEGACCQVKVNTEGYIDRIISKSDIYTFKIENSIGFEASVNTVDEDGNNKPQYALLIFVPMGGVDYELTVGQICEDGTDISSKNSSSVIITIADTIPYRLYVNDIDISTMDMNKFNIGWDDIINNKPAINRILQKNDGWLHLSNVDNYIWDNVEGFSDVEEDGKTKFQTDYIKKVKKAFCLTSTDMQFSIIITESTSKRPVNYYFYYNEEIYDEERGINILDESQKNNYQYDKTNATYLLSDIQIPTITNRDNVNYGYNGTYTGSFDTGKNISFGYDRANGLSGDQEWFKKPYLIRIINKVDAKQPVKGNIQIKMDGDSIRENYFAFHIIDKILRLNMLVWSYINNIPCCKKHDSAPEGRFINMPGLFTCVIGNGVLSDNGQFKTFTLGNRTLTVETNVADDEDSMPTRRDLKEGDDKPYGYNRKYIALPNKTQKLDIEDDNFSYISETVNGKLCIKLTNRTNDILNFSINVNDTIEYYAFVIDNVDMYPLSQANQSTEDDSWYLNVDSQNIFDFSQTKEKLLEKTKSINNIVGTYINDENATVYNFYSYGTNPVFVLKDLNNKMFYVVAVTSNNCRTISPLYMLYEVKVSVGVNKVSSVYQNNGIYDNKQSYWLILSILTDDTSSGYVRPFYLKWYDFVLDINYEYSSDVKIEFNKINSPIGEDEYEPLYIEIDENKYNTLINYFNSEMFFLSIKDKLDSSIKITDVTNMLLKTNVSSYNGDNLYAVVWNPQGFSETFIKERIGNKLTENVRENDLIYDVIKADSIVLEHISQSENELEIVQSELTNVRKNISDALMKSTTINEILSVITAAIVQLNEFDIDSIESEILILRDKYENASTNEEKETLAVEIDSLRDGATSHLGGIRVELMLGGVEDVLNEMREDKNQELSELNGISEDALTQEQILRKELLAYEIESIETILKENGFLDEKRLTLESVPLSQIINILEEGVGTITTTDKLAEAIIILQDINDELSEEKTVLEDYKTDKETLQNELSQNIDEITTDIESKRTTLGLPIKDGCFYKGWKWFTKVNSLGTLASPSDFPFTMGISPIGLNSVMFVPEFVPMQCAFNKSSITLLTVNADEKWQVKYVGSEPTKTNKVFKGWKYDISDENETPKGNEFTIDAKYQGQCEIITVFAYFENA